MAKVFIGVGHGGKDPGAIGNGFQEKDLNLVISQECNKVLVEHGVTTLMSRTKDENDDANEQVSECNAFASGSDYAVFIHNNAGGGDGVEAYYHFGGGEGKTLAENILAEIVKIGQNSRGAKTRVNSQGKDYYSYIRDTYANAVIIEVAFIDNKNDIAFVDTVAEQKAAGRAIAKGILATMGVAFKTVENTESNTTQTKSISFDELQKKLIAEGYDSITL
jgi:N-acetylmuramoyl-L-alanine amidase